MPLREEFESTGNWLFRWRSYLPFVIFPVLLVALREGEVLRRVSGDTAENLWEVFCVVISLLGLIVRCAVVGYTPRGTSGRNTAGQKAKVLNSTGWYSTVRHPLYLGNFLIFIGVVLFIQALWFVIFAVLSYWLYYERIMFAEEEFLRGKFGEDYVKWAETTPAFLPRFKNWQTPDLPFSFRNVLKREYTGLFVITTTFPLLDLVRSLISEGKPELDPAWIIFFAAGSVVYLTLLMLRKKTKILNVEGR
ncbi:MAG: DUF1295 domain-containing protein [Nitrospirae bacterium]|nr:DUF1295 domain-containing protein [Nitrospirota bacterium]